MIPATSRPIAWWRRVIGVACLATAASSPFWDTQAQETPIEGLLSHFAFSSKMLWSGCQLVRDPVWFCGDDDDNVWKPITSEEDDAEAIFSLPEGGAAILHVEWVKPEAEAEYALDGLPQRALEAAAEFLDTPTAAIPILERVTTEFEGRPVITMAYVASKGRATAVIVSTMLVDGALVFQGITSKGGDALTDDHRRAHAEFLAFVRIGPMFE